MAGGWRATSCTVESIIAINYKCSLVSSLHFKASNCRPTYWHSCSSSTLSVHVPISSVTLVCNQNKCSQIQERNFQYIDISKGDMLHKLVCTFLDTESFAHLRHHGMYYDFPFLLLFSLVWIIFALLHVLSVPSFLQNWIWIQTCSCSFFFVSARIISEHCCQ